MPTKRVPRCIHCGRTLDPVMTSLGWTHKKNWIIKELFRGERKRLSFYGCKYYDTKFIEGEKATPPPEDKSPLSPS